MAFFEAQTIANQSDTLCGSRAMPMLRSGQRKLRTRRKQMLWSPEGKTKMTERPPCPKCGYLSLKRGEMSPHSNGICWRCARCATQWSKVTIPKTDFSQRPICPYCRAQKTTKHSACRWRCGICGKTWTEEKRLAVVFFESRDLEVAHG